MECSRDFDVTQSIVTCRFARVSLTQTQLFKSYIYFAIKGSTLISSHPCFTLLVGFQGICMNTTCLAFGSMIPYNVSVGEEELGSLASNGISLDEEAWQDHPIKGDNGACHRSTLGAVCLL